MEEMKETAALERRLSELPEELNLHILSLLVDQLTHREALHLSLLSKQLQRVVQKRRGRALFFPTNVPSFEGKYTELSYVHSTLDRYRTEDIPLGTFTMIANFQPDQNGVYDQCIELAAKQSLRSLTLSLLKTYVLPESVFRVESLVELSLDHCQWKPENKVAWPNLKRLSIGKRVISTHEVFVNVITSCPLIEYLNFHSDSFTADKKFKVSNLRNLKQLCFGLKGSNLHRLEVNAMPNLESIQIRHDIDSSFIMPYNVIDFGSAEYPRLTSIDVESKGIDDKFFANFARRFPMLEKLCIRNSTALKAIDLSSASLKEIKLIDNIYLQKAHFDLPELDHLVYEAEDRKGFPKLTFRNRSGKRWSSCIKLTYFNVNIDASRLLEMCELLASLHGSETSITVKIRRSKFKMVFPVTVNHVIPVVRGIREFSLDTSELLDQISKTSLSAILDSFSSFLQPQKITLLDCKSAETTKRCAMLETINEDYERRQKRLRIH